MSVSKPTISDLDNLDDLDDLRLISFTQANRILGITNQLGHNWLWENKYPVPVRQINRNGNNYVRYRDVMNYLNRLFSEPPLNDKGKPSRDVIADNGRAS